MAVITTCRRLLLEPRLLSACRGLPVRCSGNSIHQSHVLRAIPDLGDRPSDYGKYYEPNVLENIFSSFAESSVVKGMETYLMSVQDFTGLPWWANIIACTFILRAGITAPLLVWQTKKMAKYRMIQPVLKTIVERLNKEGDEEMKKQGWDRKTRDMHVMNSFWKHKKDLMKKNKIPGTFLRYILPWIQIPIWVSMSISLRHMTLSLPVMSQISPAQLSTYSALSGGGTLWISNLCAVDSTLILPVIAGLTNLAIIEVHRGDGKVPLTGGMKALVYFVRFVSISMIPIGAVIPSAVVLYWVSSSTFGLVQALAMQSMKVKRILGIPIPISHSKTPYKDIMSRFKFRSKI